MVLNVIMKNPGLNCIELGTKIEEMYGKKNEAVQFMFLEDTDENSRLKVVINAIYCIEERQNRYYYNETLSPTDEQDLTQIFVKVFLEDLKQRKIKKEIEQHGENISS